LELVALLALMVGTPQVLDLQALIQYLQQQHQQVAVVVQMKSHLLVKTAVLVVVLIQVEQLAVRHRLHLQCKVMQEDNKQVAVITVVQVVVVHPQ
jgi:hypothetical protein